MKMEEKYKNPKDFENYIIKLKECKTLIELQNLVKEVFPTLIQEFSRGYSSDYPLFTENWYNLCNAIKTTPKGIILAEFVPPSIKDDINGEYSLLRKFLDTMVASGFVVRRSIEFFLCPNCKLMIPKFGLYKKIKFMNPERIPENWDYTCKSCEPYEKEF